MPQTPEQIARAQRAYQRFLAKNRRDAQRFCKRWLPEIRDVAWGCGYAIGLHGTVRRDIDLIAAPWIRHAAPPAVLAEAIRELIGGRPLHPRLPERKPHGRLAWSIHFTENYHVYIDISVMPPRVRP